MKRRLWDLCDYSAPLAPPWHGSGLNDNYFVQYTVKINNIAACERVIFLREQTVF